MAIMASVCWPTTLMQTEISQQLLLGLSDFANSVTAMRLTFIFFGDKLLEQLQWN